MSRPSVAVGRPRRATEPSRSAVPDSPDVPQLAHRVVPLPDASMRVLEVTVSCAALIAALLLGLAR